MGRHPCTRQRPHAAHASNPPGCKSLAAPPVRRPTQHLPATLFGTPDYHTLLDAIPQAPPEQASGAELLPEQAHFLQSRSVPAQQFLRLVEHWSDGQDILLLPGAAPSKYLLALLALHCFDATAVGENERQYATILPSAPEYQL